jgi:hypothetical protein
MSIKRIYSLVGLAVLAGVLLAGCGGSGKAEPASPQIPAVQPTSEEPLPAVEASVPLNSPEDASAQVEWQPLSDSQGAVDVVITPLNLSRPGDTIDFEVTLDTHSLDLSMDLAELAFLSAGTSWSASASSWDAPLGGHHVRGILSFPVSENWDQLLEEAGEFKLVISNLDAPQRDFVWHK